MTTEKTMTCADCNAIFTYNETPGYPRKYCPNCSSKRKADFNAKAPQIENQGVADAVNKNVARSSVKGTAYEKDPVGLAVEVFSAICTDHKGADANSIMANMDLSIRLVKQAQEAFN